MINEIANNKQSLILKIKDYFPPCHILLCAIIICIGSLNMGMVYAFPSPAFYKINNQPNSFQLIDKQLTWAIGSANVGGIVGGMTGRLIVDHFGRKTSFMLLITLVTVGWLIILSSQWPWMVILGRCVTGVGVGIAWIVSPVYVSEIAPKDNRGLLLMIHSFSLSIGIFITFVIGEFCSWRYLIVFYLCLNTIASISGFFIPDSPRWLFLKGYNEEAAEALRWYRKTQNVEVELQEIRENILSSSKRNFKIKEVFKREIYYPLLLTLGLITIQVWSGINVFNAYLQQIFSASEVNLDSLMSSTIIGGTRVLGNFAIVPFMDKVKRRKLLFISAIGMTLGLFFLVVFFAVKTKNSYFVEQHLRWLPITSLVLYVITFNIGYSQLPTAMIGELLPLRVRGCAGGIAVAWGWICIFISVQSYPSIVKVTGEIGPFIIYTAVSFIGVLFAVFLLPETKGKTLEEIEKSFRKNSSSVTELETKYPTYITHL